MVVDELTKDYRKIILELEDYAIIMLDEHGNVKDWNKGAEYLKGYKSEEIIGKSFRLFYTKEDRENNLPEQLIKQAKKTGKACTEGWRVKKDGSLFWGSVTIKASYDDTKVVTGFMKITHDLSDRKEKEEATKKHNQSLKSELKQTKQKLIASEIHYKNTFDHMPAGVQIHDFNWVYTYVNEAHIKYSTLSREELMGKSLFETNPHIEKSEDFQFLQRCMIERRSEHFEREVILQNGETALFEVNIQPVPEGLLILSTDRTEQGNALRKLAKKKRSYSFLSAINQSIVHIKSEQELLDRVVHIAKEIGEYKSAYTGMLSTEGKLEIKSVHADAAIAQIIQKISGIDLNDPLMKNIAWVSALKSGQYTFNNDMQNDPALAHLKEIFIQGNVQSSISLPLKMFGKTGGLLAFHSSSKDFFDEDEIALLVEAAGDISFALENYEKTKKHEQTELLVEKNEKRFRGLIEKSTDMTTITDKEGKLVYVSPSVIKLFKFSEQELIGQRAMTFFHSDDISDLIEKRNAILNIPGGHYDFTVRLKHKEEDWVWCEGTVINYLDDSAIKGLVTNFRDITQRRQLELQREFDQNNLHALINNTKDLMWSVDRFFHLITSNKPFDDFIKNQIHRTLVAGDSLLQEEFGAETIKYFKDYYERAFQGEAFSEVSQNQTSKESWSEISFYPIKKGEEIIGTACFSKDISESKKSAKEKEAFITELSQNNQDLRQFAYITSHNLRGPVANLLGLTNLLDSYNFEDPMLLKIHEGIKKAANSFDETIRDLAGILTIKEGSTVSTERIVFKEICEKVLSFFESTITNTGVIITCDFKEAQEVTFNRAYLESIFTNLLSNSIKYRDKGRTLVINANTQTINDELILRFSDNGMGFDSEKQKGKVFQLYQRFHNNAEGKGLGLYLIKSQIEAMGGTISVHSQPNNGTIFTIKFKKNLYLADDLQIQQRATD
jgi:PAS domain S-box-containing protein